MRIPEAQELARLIELYGEEDGRRRLAERKREMAFIKPWIDQGRSLKWIARQLARQKYPELYRRR